MSEISAKRAESILCPCGCGKSYPMFNGVLRYEEESKLVFKIAHFSHSNQGVNLWVLLGVGPWIESDKAGSWIALQNWVADENLTLRIADPKESPFRSEHIYDERFLTRDEVLGKEGGLEWVVARRDDLIRLHKQSFEFLGLDDA